MERDGCSGFGCALATVSWDCSGGCGFFEAGLLCREDGVAVGVVRYELEACADVRLHHGASVSSSNRSSGIVTAAERFSAVLRPQPLMLM